MSCYPQLTMPERMRLYTFLEMVLSKIQIARRMDIHRSTIYREVQRNHPSIGCLPGIAHRKSLKRRADKPGKIRTGTRLYDYILRGLKRGLSPEQIAWRMKREGNPYYVCHETIYRYIYRLGNKGLYRLLHYRKRPMPEKRLAVLDDFRAIAITLVVVMHGYRFSFPVVETNNPLLILVFSGATGVGKDRMRQRRQSHVPDKCLPLS